MATPAIKLTTGGTAVELTVHLGGSDFCEALNRDRAGITHSRYGVPVASRTWKNSKTWNYSVNSESQAYMESLRPFFEAGSFYLYPDISDSETYYTVFWIETSFEPQYLAPDKYSLRATFKETTIGAGTPIYIGGDTSQTVNGDLSVIGDLNVTGSFDVNSLEEVKSNGNVYVNYDGPDANSYLYFYNNSSSTGRYLRWNEGVGFEFNYNLDVIGDILEDGTLLGDKYSTLVHTHPASDVTNGTFPSSSYDFAGAVNINGGVLGLDDNDTLGVGLINFCNTDSTLMYIKATHLFSFNKSINVTGSLNATSTLNATGTITSSNNVIAGANVYVNNAGINDNGSIYFHDGASTTGGYLHFNKNTDEFTLSNSITVDPDSTQGKVVIDTSAPYYGVGIDLENATGGWARGLTFTSGSTYLDGSFKAYGDDNTGVLRLQIGSDYNGNGISVLPSNGFVGINKLSPTVALDVVGSFDVSGDILSGSTNINEIFADRTKTKSLSLLEPVVLDEVGLFFTDKAITVDQLNCYVRGSSTPSVLYYVYHATTRNAASATVINSATITSEAGISDTSFDDATIPVNSYIWVKIIAVSGTVDEFHMTLKYTED